MDKFGRTYTLEVQSSTGSLLTIRLPFTIEFDIIRNTLTSANVCQIRIYNLSKVNRDLIRFNISDYGQFRLVRLSAGYGSRQVKVFEGNISQAWSVREGVNFITQIESYDGGFAFNNGYTNRQYGQGTPLKSVLTDLVSTLPEVSPGAIGDYPGSLSRSESFAGPTAQVIADITGGGFYVDQSKAYILRDNEFVQDGAPLIINSQSGLLGTPVLEQTIVRFDMLFEPSLNVGRKIILRSDTESNFNGDYKVTAVKHRGMISESVAGSVITTGEFFFNKLLTGVIPIG